jgi:hypothetical protein
VSWTTTWVCVAAVAGAADDVEITPSSAAAARTTREGSARVTGD